MFSKVMIANRGAIATRIIRTLQQLNIPSLAVYAESDADSLHVRNADQAFSLGDGVAAETYLDMDKIIAIAKANGVDAIHPGYGFLSENAAFVRRCEAEGIVFIGPTPEQMELFGLKHKARALAQQADVPLTPGTELLKDLQSAVTSAEAIGYPVMLKSTAGGGGIGMQLCHSSEEVSNAFESVKRLGANNFANDGVFIEKFIARARHIEVQVFGDGNGGALAIGERDCSSQRRNQKVVEECPAPNLTDEMRQQLYRTAESLLASVSYRNAGTVEFIYDADTDAFYFLEVNTRLQVEHGVTEEVYGVDLVAWMIKQAAAESIDLQTQRSKLSPQGHAVQVRLYAEDPYRDFQPSPGLLTEVSFPDDQDVRIDHWIESGVEIPAYFDPMLAKVIVHGADRKQAFEKLQSTLSSIRLYGSETNLDYLSVLSRDPLLLAGEVTTRYLNDFVYTPSRIDVLQGGTQTTIQDYPARSGYWDVGVPPSGPFDNYSFQLANRLLDNDPDAAGMEITMQGPSLKFSCACRIAVTGAEIEATLDGEALAMWTVVAVHAGQTLSLGRIKQQGARSYLAISGGIACPDYLGSKSTFTLGQFGGHNGRALRAGDVLRISAFIGDSGKQTLPEKARPEITHEWQLRVIYGPHGAPDFFTQPDIDRFFSHQWEVHYNSSRTGIRLIGPKPEWARQDGGEAGLHPSNIHDNAYAFGTVDFTGDMPVILGPDGPSLGGFVCPATVIQADLWKLGQLRAGDKVSFIAVDLKTAVRLEKQQIEAVGQLKALPDRYPSGELTRNHSEIDTFETPRHPGECRDPGKSATNLIPASAAMTNAFITGRELTTPIIDRLDRDECGVDVVYRLAGDHFMLVEYGEQVLDISLRFRAHALMQWLQQHPLDGLQELTPGIRSLQLHFDSQRLSHRKLLLHLKTAEQALASQIDQLHVPSRIVHIPLSWDDQACQKAIEKYDQSVRKNAPWCPSNLEFIRRINGLESLDEVKRIVFDASYLVMGLGDVYLGAPVATPVDPRHRLVTTKYNPARTWTAENSVGIGGSYLCVYGMEGPGGYQFVGRTLQMWNRYKQTAAFEKPWLLRFFDQIRFYEVSEDELAAIRKDFPQGRYPIKIEESQFSLTEYQDFIETHQADIEAFRRHRQQAFETELAQWHADGQFNFEVNEQTEEQAEASWPEESLVIDSPISGSVWQTEVTVGQQVKAGDCLMILESMKMEIPVYASADSRVTHVLLENGQRVGAGQALVVLQEG